MKISKRHHYVPIFLAKNFSNKKGKLIIYDKEKDKVFEAIPKNIFLENDRNNFENQRDEKVDTIEKMYADLDSKFAKTLRDVKETGNLERGNLRMLLFLAYTTKWRVPRYDKSFDDAKKFFSVDDLGLGIKIDNSKLDYDLEKIFKTDLQQELKRFLLAIQPFRFKEDYKKISKNSFLISTPFPALIGDCPVNEVQIESKEVFEDFVFPITDYLTLVNSQRIDKYKLKEFLENGKTEKVNQFLKDFSISKDLSTMALSKRFSGGSDKKYLNSIINGYKNGQNNTRTKNDMHNYVFNILYSYEKYMN